MKRTARTRLLMAAVAGITAGAASTSRLALAEDKADVRCWGINSCGHHSKCSVSAEDLAAVKALLGDKEYDQRFGKSETHSCGSHAKCGASQGILNWTPTTAGECTAKGGMVIETKDGKKVARKA